MSTISSSATSSIALSGSTTSRSVLASMLELVKFRLSALVVLTAAVGYVMAGSELVAVNWSGLVLTVVGVSLAAFSAAALNQVIEARRDQRMERTRNRPLPAGEISTPAAFATGVLLGLSGVALLTLATTASAGLLAAATILLYVCVYTPLKPLSTLNTLAGAVVGALPPMIGWVAAGNSITEGAWVLAGLLFVWQLPHFLSLAWLYRDDYARGGFRMLSNVDDSGVLTGRVVFSTALLLLPLGMAATLVGLAGWIAAIGSLVAGAWLAWLSLRFLQQPTRQTARAVFFGSIIYLPVVMMLLVLDRGAIGGRVLNFAALTVG